MIKALTQLDLFSQQLRQEYQRKHRWLGFFCPKTKINKANKIEWTARLMRADFDRFMRNYQAGKKFDFMAYISMMQRDKDLVAGILSHRTKHLLQNISKNHAEWGTSPTAPIRNLDNRRR